MKWEALKLAAAALTLGLSLAASGGESSPDQAGRAWLGRVPAMPADSRDALKLWTLTSDGGLEERSRWRRSGRWAMKPYFYSARKLILDGTPGEVKEVKKASRHAASALVDQQKVEKDPVRKQGC